MKLTLHNRESILAVLAVGGLLGLFKEIVAGVIALYRLALTPQGAAAVLVGTFLLAAAAVLVGLLRK